MNRWKSVKLGDVVEFNPDSIKKGYPHKIIEYLDIASVGSNVSHGTQTYIRATAPGRARRLVCDGDTIFSTVRPNLKTYLKIVNPPDNLVVSTGFAVLRPTDAIDKNFLFFAVTNQPIINELSAIADSKTTSYPAVTADDIANIEIYMPVKNTQTKIGVLLSAYDNLIENNNRRIAILEEMAQRLYREWFVHFRFPGHEDVKMVESEWGLIPERWEVVPFSTAVDINPRYPNPKNTSYAYVEMAGLDNSSMIVSVSERRNEFKGSKFANGDTLVARITPCLENGKTGYVQCLSENEVGIGSTEFIVLRANSILPEMVYLIARQEDFRELLIKSMSGASGRQRANAIVLNDYYITIPTQAILEDFSKIILPIFRQIQNLDEKTMFLRKTRDHLLPRLISGDIDVSDLPIKTKED